MSEIRLIEAPLEIDFDESGIKFEREFAKLSQSDDDPLGHWLRVAKAKGDTSGSDQVLLTLLVELHRKVDELSSLMKDEKTDFLPLSHSVLINSIGHEHFLINEEKFEVKKQYYGRILMPVFPKRYMGVFFEAIGLNLAKIIKMHEKDQSDWSAYVVARERVLIRQMKAENG